MTRRELLGAAGGYVAQARPGGAPFHWAICNETFAGSSFREGCRLAREAGFAGLEIAPFTLSEDPAALSRDQRRAVREAMAAEKIAYVGLQAFLSAPKGLHLTGPDAAVRARSWEYFRQMLDLAADLGAGAVMVLGSGRQRAAVEGVSVAEATARLREGLAALAAQAEARRVEVLLEPLAGHLCNVVTSLEEAVAMVREINSPYVQTIFDTHNAVNEKLPHAELVKKYHRHIRHVHVNEIDGRRPGAGDYDFRPVLQALQDLGYRRWVSVEVFDFTPGGERIARESFQHLSRLAAGLR